MFNLNLKSFFKIICKNIKQLLNLNNNFFKLLVTMPVDNHVWEV